MSQESQLEKIQKPKKRRNWRLQNLPCVFTVRTNKEERAQLEKMAAKANLSLSRLVVEATLYLGVKSSEDAQLERAILELMIFEIRKISIRLKEIMHALNVSQREEDFIYKEQEIEITLRSIESVVYRLRKRL